MLISDTGAEENIFKQNAMLSVCFSPSGRHDDLDTPAQQQARISASCATRELDELMASLSDFKVLKGTFPKEQNLVLSPSSFAFCPLLLCMSVV